MGLYAKVAIKLTPRLYIIYILLYNYLFGHCLYKNRMKFNPLALKMTKCHACDMGVFLPVNDKSCLFCLKKLSFCCILRIINCIFALFC